MTDQERQAETLYLRGNEHRQKGEWHLAINCYTEAMELDADSPAAEAKAMLERILEYRCKDYYNP